MFVTYTDLTECCYKLAVQHMTGAGEPAPGWPANGRRLVDNAGDQDHEVIIPDGAGGAIVAWTDARQAPGDPNIYAQRIEPDGPTPVLVSLVSVAAETDWVRLEWSAAGGTMLAADVERRSETSDWERLTTLTLDGTGRLRYEDRAVSPGARYAYRLSYTDGAAIVRTAETWVTVPVPRFALRGLTPNPSAGDPVIAFTLTSAEPASIELYDLAGRLVLAREVGSLGPGAQSVRLETRGHLAAGVYTVVLRQGTQLAKARAVLLR
jgi:hypothetical protein